MDGVFATDIICVGGGEFVVESSLAITQAFLQDAMRGYDDGAGFYEFAPMGQAA